MYTKRTEYHHLRVVDIGGVRSLEFDGHRQSAIDMSDGFTSDIRYTDYLHLSLAWVPHPRLVLVIGLGGGAFPKRMWRDYRDIERIDCVELDPAVVEIARRYFGLPEDDRLRVHVAEGRRFVQRSAERYDIIAVDAYFADALPYPLVTEEFFRELDERLTDDGVVAYNIIGAVEGGRSRTFRSIYKTMAQVWPAVHVFAVDVGWMLDPRRIRNIVVFATRSPLTRSAILERIMSRLNGRVAVPRFRLFADDLYPKPVRTSDVPVLVDATMPPNGFVRL